MSTSSPFDELSDESASGDEDAPATRRKRRPWWRWNIVTLAIALFALIWLRELIGFELGMVWLLVFSVAAVWFVTPAFFVPTRLTTLSEIPEHTSTNRRAGRIGDRVIVGFKAAALFFVALSLVHFVVMCVLLFPAITSVWFSGTVNGGPSFFFQTSMLGAFAQPISEFVVSAILYVLCEIALRLEKR